MLKMTRMRAIRHLNNRVPVIISLCSLNVSSGAPQREQSYKFHSHGRLFVHTCSDPVDSATEWFVSSFCFHGPWIYLLILKHRTNKSSGVQSLSSFLVSLYRTKSLACLST